MLGFSILEFLYYCAITDLRRRRASSQIKLENEIVSGLDPASPEERTQPPYPKPAAAPRGPSREVGQRFPALARRAHLASWAPWSRRSPIVGVPPSVIPNLAKSLIVWCAKRGFGRGTSGLCLVNPISTALTCWPFRN